VNSDNERKLCAEIKRLRSDLAKISQHAKEQNLDPVWIRIPAASRASGLSRTFLFEQIVKGTIKSKHLKRLGKSRGIRLINYASLMAFIDGLES
jgi:hypothetical protein